MMITSAVSRKCGERCNDILNFGNCNRRSSPSRVHHVAIVATKMKVVGNSKLKNSWAIGRASRLTEWVLAIYQFDTEQKGRLKKREKWGIGVIYYLSAIGSDALPTTRAFIARELLSERSRGGSYPARSLVHRITSIIHPPLMIAAASAFVKTYSAFAFVARARARAPGKARLFARKNR